MTRLQNDTSVTTDGADRLVVAALQMVSTTNVDENLSTAARLIAQAAQQGAQLVVLPEYFCLLGKSEHDKIALREHPGSGRLQQFLSNCARTHQLWLIGGTIPLVADQADRARNSCLVFDPQGKQCARYDKVHLFSFTRGNESYDEARTLSAGDRAVSFELKNQHALWRVGLSVCYDLRFPELFRAQNRPDLIVVPAAFTATTGKAHWHVLLRARAIENLCYVLGAAQGGHHENGRDTYGHSILIDPWGETVAECALGEAVVLGQIDRARLSELRTALPALDHRIF